MAAPIARADQPTSVSAAPRRAQSPAPSSAWCEASLAVRAVGAVQLALCAGAALALPDLAQLSAALGPALVLSLLCTLVWLMGACRLSPRLRTRSPGGRAMVLALLAMALAWAGLNGLLALGLLPADGWVDRPLRWVALMLAAGVPAAFLSRWVDSRERQLSPVQSAARLAELQSRIRPHFLFNTLNTAVALVRADPPRAEQVLEDLAELFRVALADERSRVSLAEEVALARRYLDIEAVRFGARLQVQWTVDDAALEAVVPPLLLQPLVENAVRHGVEPLPGGGTVEVLIRRRPGRVLVNIVNPRPEGGAGRPGHGLALDNIRQRLALVYDLGASLTVRESPDRYEVRLSLPMP